MANSWFQFKEFKIEQAGAAMKVSTDACIFGAFVASEFEGRAFENILDIGAGTGILSLMLAQKLTGILTAIELDSASAAQCRENFENSPWPERLSLIEGDARQVELVNKYDLIISNPPYFSNALISPVAERSMAKHEEALSPESIMAMANRYLAHDGYIALLYPNLRGIEIKKALNSAGFHLNKHLLIRNNPAKQPKWVVLIASRNNRAIPVNRELILKDEAGNYTGEARKLLKDYYLYL